MENFSEFDKSFSISKISSYKLSLQLSDEGYAYVITDTIRSLVVAMVNKNFEDKSGKNLLDKISIAIKEDVYLNKNYKSVDFLVNTPKFTLVPTEFFDKKHLKSFFKYGNVLHDYEEIHFNKLDFANTYCVFAIPSEMTTYLVNKFPEIRFLHQASLMIEKYLERGKKSKSEAPTVVLNVTKNYMQILTTEKNNLKFFNTFEQRGTTDIIYFLLNTLEKLNYQPHKVELILSGDIIGGKELHTKLIGYIQDVKFAVSDDNLTYGITKIPEHYLSAILYDR